MVKSGLISSVCVVAALSVSQIRAGDGVTTPVLEIVRGPTPNPCSVGGKSNTDMAVSFQDSESHHEESPRETVADVLWFAYPQTYWSFANDFFTGSKHTPAALPGVPSSTNAFSISVTSPDKRQATLVCAPLQAGFYSSYPSATVMNSTGSSDDTSGVPQVVVEAQAAVPTDLVAKDSNDDTRSASAADGKTLTLVYKGTSYKFTADTGGDGSLKVSIDNGKTDTVKAALKASTSSSLSWAPGDPTWQSQYVSGADGSDSANWVTSSNGVSDNPKVTASSQSKSVSIKCVNNNALDVSVKIKQKSG